jgi:hypothetical protein
VDEINLTTGMFGNLVRMAALTTSDAGPYFKKIWKGKIPAKIYFFFGLLQIMQFLLEII